MNALGKLGNGWILEINNLRHLEAMEIMSPYGYGVGLTVQCDGNAKGHSTWLNHPTPFSKSDGLERKRGHS